MPNSFDLPADTSHLLITAKATLYILKTLLLVLIYYRLYRIDCGRQLAGRTVTFSRSLVRKFHAAKFIGRHPVRIGGRLLAAFLLLLPFMTISLAERILLREVRSFHFGTAVNLSRLDWIKDNLLPLSAQIFIFAAVVGCYVVFDSLIAVKANKTVSSKRERQHRVIGSTRLGGTVRRLWSVTRQPRKRIATTNIYRYAWYVITISCALGLIQLMTNSDPPSPKVRGGQVLLMEESPRREAILSLVKEAGFDQITIQVEHLPKASAGMNAKGTYKHFGARILFFSTTLDGLNDEELLFITAHELYHVRQFNWGTYGAVIFLLGSLAVVLFIGPPKPVVVGGVTRAGRRLRSRFITRVPLYALIFITAWPVFQTVRCALARHREAEADRYATQLTVPRKVSLDSAKGSLTKVGRSNLTDPAPYWFAKWLFYDHPPLRERLQIIEETAKPPTTDGKAAGGQQPAVSTLTTPLVTAALTAFFGVAVFVGG